MGTADDLLLARQDALQAEASAVLADLDLFELLQAVGRPVQTGSSALGLTVGRDIDVTSLCLVLEPLPIFDAIRPLANHPSVVRLNFRNDTGRWRTEPEYPDGLYWTVKYRTDSGDDWNLDLWFLLEGTTQFDLQHVVSLPPRLTPEARLAILRIKEAWHGLPAYGTRPGLRHLRGRPGPWRDVARGIRVVPERERQEVAAADDAVAFRPVLLPN